MFPQTHVFFAQKVLEKESDAVTLGSIFPDMAIGAGINRDISHSSGLEMFNFLKSDGELRDFALASITHGVSPGGLDYYGDEKNPPHERGYCFEKGRSLVEHTVKACNIPPEMGWWKAHNIVEMGIEMRIGTGVYGQCLHSAFHNMDLIRCASERLGEFYGVGSQPITRRMSYFHSYIDLAGTTAESLAAKYDYQMQIRHNVRINVGEVARLINLAAEMVADDIEHFFTLVTAKVKEVIDSTVQADEKNEGNCRL